MRTLLKDTNNISNYIDDILIHTQSWEIHIQTLNELLNRLKKSGLTARKCIPNYAIASPLTDKTKAKEPNRITWGEHQQLAFNKLKQCLSKAPILMLPDFEKQFIIRTDASDLGIGAISFPVAFASRKLLSYHF